MTHFTTASSGNFLMQLVDPALRALVIAVSAGMALAAFRVRTTSARLLIWKAVLCVALAMPVLGRILPTLAISMPSVLQVAQPLTTSQNHIESNHSHALVAAQASLQKNVAEGNIRTPPGIQGSAERQARTPLPWAFTATAIYLAVAALLLMRMLIGQILGRRLVRRAEEICDERLTMSLARRIRSFGLASIPHCAESEAAHVPLTIGVLHPTILLPNGWREWHDAKLDAVVAHEMSHVARRDALTQMLSLLHRAIFWFSPLAWWLDRHLADLAEQASDEAALCCGADSNDYAQALLGFFESLHAAPGRVWWQGVAMAKAGQAERRLERILAWKKEGAITMGLKKSVAAIIFVLAIPVVFLAASIHPVNGQDAPKAAQDQAPPSPNSTLPAPAAPSVFAPTAPVSAAEPIAPVEPLSPSAAWSGQSGRSRHSYAQGSGYSYAYGSDDDDRFAIVSGKADSMTMSGSWQDVHHLERLRKQISGDFIWFQRDEKSYIIRDQDMIDRARKYWAPQEELGRKQEELGKQQEALGKQQEALGRKMEQVKVDVPDMTAALDKLKAELKALGPTATQDQLGQIQSEIGELQSRIGEMQSHAGEHQSKVGEEMSTLGEQQSKLGEQQDELGHKQEAAAWEAIHKMKELFDEAIKSGKAQPEPQSGGSASM